MSGDLIRPGSADIAYNLEEALACYGRAVVIDPRFAEGREGFGNFHDAVMPHPGSIGSWSGAHMLTLQG